MYEYRSSHHYTRSCCDLLRGFVPILVLLLTVPASAGAESDVLSRGNNGTPTFVTGHLGTIDAAESLDLKGRDAELLGLAAKNVLLGILAENFAAQGGEDMEVLRIRQDELGKVHVRFQQYLNGLIVVGAQMYLHAEAATGEVYAVNGEFAPDADVAYPGMVKVSKQAVGARLAELGIDGELVGEPEMLYFHDAESSRTHLAWKLRTRGTYGAGLPFDDEVYVDARSFEVVGRDAHIHSAKRRLTYDARNTEVLPGALRCNERVRNCNDASAQRAHNGAGTVYDYYRTRFGRNSVNGRGMTLASTTHFGWNVGNAFWDGNRRLMIYGDGDSRLDDLTKSFDVIAHEFTHGVTQFESNLRYAKESGALNEALSDIFGVAADTYRRGGVIDSATWKLAEQSFTPGIPGDAMRYMNDPERDRFSKSFYPERNYRGGCTPSRANDQCGVHTNSGIANLAFYLMVRGGRHPRGKTTVRVPAIGMARVERIFYRAQTTCLTPSSNFQAARNCTARAATELYGATTGAAVHKAWDAVGVPGGPGAGGGGSCGASGSANNLTASTGEQLRYTFEVNPCASRVTFTLSGGFGDADLYVRRGARPTTTGYHCRSNGGNNNESCTINSARGGTYYILVRAYRSFSGVTLRARYE